MTTMRTAMLRSLALLAIGAVLWANPAAAETTTGEGDPHVDLFSEESYPSASQCKTCHEQIYNEWRSSNHAYAGISPMFHKFEQKINDLSVGTIGTFCVRCHQSGGTVLGEERWAPLWERSQISREGVTCITCHRVAEQYTRGTNGERRIIPGNIHEPVYGPIGGDGVAKVVEDASYWKVATSPEERGAKIHTKGVKFDQLSKSEFCASCHQVAVNVGIKLEVVWDQYRASPAAAEGVSCQDCHMSQDPGRASGFTTGPIAVVNGEPVDETRTHHDHSFAGPGYSIAHPGIFPHNVDSEQWTIEEWLQFDYRAGWGSEEFEEKIDGGELEVAFPEVWADPFDREEAWEIVQANIEANLEKQEMRRRVMENGSRIDGPYFDGTPSVGSSLSFTYNITNTNPGHNLPSGSLGAQPEIWLNVALIDPDGNNVWESGYVDSAGDMADLRSVDVLEGRLPADNQLVNLQSKFLTTNVKGTDREMSLPINVDVDQLPFLRPSGTPTTVINHPPFVRMEARSIPPLGVREASYTVPGELITKPGTYKLAVRMRNRAEPIYFMRFVEATSEMEQSMNQWMIDVHPYTVEFVAQ
ncbi:MAG: cytochrome C [Alphaproteobacteria bacterium]|nr:cytochrome C [Alphaproteobacteria bacterium]